MNNTLRQKYNLDDRHPAFPRYDRINNNEKENNKKTKCFIGTTLCAITLLNTL